MLPHPNCTSEARKSITHYFYAQCSVTRKSRWKIQLKFLFFIFRLYMLLHLRRFAHRTPAFDFRKRLVAVVTGFEKSAKFIFSIFPNRVFPFSTITTTTTNSTQLFLPDAYEQKKQQRMNERMNAINAKYQRTLENGESEKNKVNDVIDYTHFSIMVGRWEQNAPQDMWKNRF
jgi:hypothetical protein